MSTQIEKRVATDSPQGHKLLFACAMVFVTTLLVSNTIAVKLVSFDQYAVAAGIICFPISYIFGDVLTEVYGYRQTKRVIWWGFLCLGLMAAFYSLATILPPAPFYQNEAAFDSIFSQSPRIVTGSLVGYLVGSFLNSIVMSRLKVWTNGRLLWLRTVLSTIFGELGDSFVFAVIAFAGVLAWNDLWVVATTGFFLKTAYEIVATPITYLIVGRLKQIEGVDVYDRGEKYSVLPE